MSDEARFFYVLERYSFDTLEYWHPDGFTSKFDVAIKFWNKQSADQVLSRLCQGIGRSTQHGYMKP